MAEFKDFNSVKTMLINLIQVHHEKSVAILLKSSFNLLFSRLLKLTNNRRHEMKKIY